MASNLLAHITLRIGDGFSNSLGKALDEMDRITLLIMTCLIVLEIILVVIGVFHKKKGYRVFLGIISTIFLVPVIFSYQHEVQMYASGTILLITVLVGLYVATNPLDL